MSKKSFQAASVALIKDLGDFQSGYFDHAHIVAAETKVFVRGFDSQWMRTSIQAGNEPDKFVYRLSQSKVTDAASQPLKDARQRMAENSIAFDTLLGSVNSLKEAAKICTEMAGSTRLASHAESTHITARLTARENREPFQEKEMTAFLAIQQDERAKIDEEFENKVEELKHLYAA